MLSRPSSHEPLTDLVWDESRARAAIVDVVARTEAAFDEQALWPAHPLDEDDGPLTRVASLYLGAAGVIWALHELERVRAVELQREWSDVASSLAETYRAEPDFSDLLDGPVPSLWMGEAGILFVAHRLSPAAWQEQRLLEAVHANVENPTWELMWGSPGTMLAAQVMYERTGGEHWLDAWNASADRLWEEWRDDLWLQDLYGSRDHILGPAHGFAGNVFVLARGDLLDPARRGELERRAVAAVAKHAVRADGLAQWPAALERSQETRTQWCQAGRRSATARRADALLGGSGEPAQIEPRAVMAHASWTYWSTCTAGCLRRSRWARSPTSPLRLVPKPGLRFLSAIAGLVPRPSTGRTGGAARSRR